MVGEWPTVGNTVWIMTMWGEFVSMKWHNSVILLVGSCTLRISWGLFLYFAWVRAKSGRAWVRAKSRGAWVWAQQRGAWVRAQPIGAWVRARQGVAWVRAQPEGAWAQKRHFYTIPIVRAALSYTGTVRKKKIWIFDPTWKIFSICCKITDEQFYILSWNFWVA